MTKVFPSLLPAFEQRFLVSDPELVVETPQGVIWRVKRADGTPAALKIYPDASMSAEAAGFDLMVAQNGLGATLIYDRSETAVLMEWLDGPSLGDLVRAGDDDKASHLLVETANRLHQMPSTPIASLDPLEDRFQPLFDARFAADCPPDAMAALRRATRLAQRLLANQSDKRPLHGDFHHENVKGSPRGYLAFDAKGVFGDRHFELANAFWNPLSEGHFVTKRQTILRRAAIWAEGFRADQKTLLDWAAAYTALSLSWTFHGTFGPRVSGHMPYLNTLLSLIDDG